MLFLYLLLLMQFIVISPPCLILVRHFDCCVHYTALCILSLLHLTSPFLASIINPKVYLSFVYFLMLAEQAVRFERETFEKVRVDLLGGLLLDLLPDNGNGATLPR